MIYGKGADAPTVCTFFELTTKRKKIVYLIDSSLNTTGAIETRIRSELLRSLEALTDSQSFNVIYYSDNGTSPIECKSVTRFG